MKYLILIPFLFVGCANVSTTRFEYVDAVGARVVVEMPKEVDAKALKVSINAKSGTATISAKEWHSRNAETIKAQSARESAALEKVAEGAARGAVKGLKSGL